MAQQYPPQSRPFMAKETFDQVSNVMWGHNALDYHKNYLTPRALWSDFDIREEALYYAGVAHGIRSRQVGSGALQKPSQPMVYRGNPTLGSSGSNYQSSCTQMGSPFGVLGVPWATPPPGLHPGTSTRYSKTTDMPLGLYHPNYVRYTSPMGEFWYYGPYSAVPPGHIGKYASMGPHPPPSSNPVASTSHNLSSKTGAPQGFPSAAQLCQMQVQGKMQAARRQDDTSTCGMPAYHRTTGPDLITPDPKTGYLTVNPAQISNTTASRTRASERAGAFGEHSGFAGKPHSVPLTDDQASHHSPEKTFHHSTSQIPAADLKETSALSAKVEDPSEEDRSDDDYSRIGSPSAWEDSSNSGDSTKSMEKWFEEQAEKQAEEQAEREISHMSKTWW